MHFYSAHARFRDRPVSLRACLALDCGFLCKFALLVEDGRIGDRDHVPATCHAIHHVVMMIECRVDLLLRWLSLVLNHGIMLIGIMRQLTLSSLLLCEELLSRQRLLWRLPSRVLERTHPIRLCLLLRRLLLLLLGDRLLLLDGILPAHLSHIAAIGLLLLHHNCRLLLSHVDEAVALRDHWFICSALVGTLRPLLLEVCHVGTCY